VRRFGSRTALDGVDLEVGAGEIHALLGPNGAGKTTLIRIVAGLAEPDAGEVVVNGALGLVPSGDRTMYLRISGIENLIFFGRLYGLRRQDARRRAAELMDAVGLADVGRLPVGRYSHGMQKRLSVARGLLVEPAVMLVDEATHDLDPEGARQIQELIRSVADRGVAVVWTTQRIEEIREFADAVTVLHRGRVRFAGSVEQMIATAPDPRYVVQVRNGNPARPPEAAALQRALGDAARVWSSPAGLDQYVLAPAEDRALGAAIASLASAGYDVLACRRERGEVEEAFLALAAEDADGTSEATA
jgi:ABC-type multidrug transport system ATPase subunit